MLKVLTFPNVLVDFQNLVLDFWHLDAFVENGLTLLQFCNDPFKVKQYSLHSELIRTNWVVKAFTSFSL